MRNIETLKNALSYIPSDDRNTWLKVLGALKHESVIGELDEGIAYNLADEWSRNSDKYDSTDLLRVWTSLKDNVANLATCGVIFHEASLYGYTPKKENAIKPLIFGSTVVTQSDLRDYKPSNKFECKNHLLTFLKALYKSDDKINIVTQCVLKEDKGKYIPTGIGLTQTISEWEHTIKSSYEQTETFFGQYGINDQKQSYNHDAGGWIRLNPLNGSGVHDSDVVNYRYALIESDTDDKEKQLDLINKLNLPVKAIIDSGNKSIHAIVEVNAKDASDYGLKVRWLYDFCKSNGLEVDYNDSNPSRLYRLPGLERGNNLQYCLNIYDNVQDFETWQASMTMGVPCDVASDWDSFNPEKELAPVLIDGILRQGHKMLVGGPSKAGKSMALIELAAALSTGTKWLGAYQCQQAKVLYINMEIDPPSFVWRVHKVFNALNLRPPKGMLDIWHLRGVNPELSKLVETTISYASKNKWDAIIVDPIYKLRIGDENSADAVGTLCAAFDRLAAVMGASIIYAHHFAKGTSYSSAAKSVADRVSGSGVFGRDADAIISLLQLDFEPSPDKPYQTAWKLDSCLREFAPLGSINLFYDYPVHKIDKDGLLNESHFIGDFASKGGETRGKQEVEERQDKIKDLENFLHSHLELSSGHCEIVKGIPSIKTQLVLNTLNLSKPTLSRYIKELPQYTFYRVGKVGYISLNNCEI